jgi:hypothetical protein
VIGGLALLVSVVFAAVPVGATVHLSGTVTAIALAASAAGLVAVALMWRFLRAPGVPALSALAASVCLFYALTFAGVAPRLDPLWNARSVAATLADARSCAQGPLASAGFSEPSMAFVNGTGIRLTDAVGAAETLLTDPDCALVVVEGRQADDFAAAVAVRGLVVEAVGQVRGLNYSRGREVELTVYRATPG